MSAIEHHHYTMLRIKQSNSLAEKKELALRHFLYDAELLQDEWRKKENEQVTLSNDR